MSKKKLNRDQKRKKKLAERKARQRHPVVEPYEGTKYQADEFVPLMAATEMAIQEADVMMDRQLTDREVIRCLESLVLDLRGEKPEQTKDSEDLVVANIFRHWTESGGIKPGQYSLADRIGVLRTLLHSIPLRNRYHGGSRGYLNFIDRFLARGGFAAFKLTPEEVAAMELDVSQEDDGDEQGT